jgi:hypothetical protein
MPLWKSFTTRAVLAALGGFAMSAAVAQSPAPPRDPNMPDPKNVPAEKVAPPLSDSTNATGQTLSDKLEKTEGVITPPPMGSGMVVQPPVPNPGTTPVIPPPGSSPTDPVQPK